MFGDARAKASLGPCSQHKQMRPLVAESIIAWRRGVLVLLLHRYFIDEYRCLEDDPLRYVQPMQYPKNVRGVVDLQRVAVF
jgi:hypothetical protein